MLEKTKKQNIISEYSKHQNDTGSTNVQIAILTARINRLNEHFKVNPKDFGSGRGLKVLVGQRNRLLKYLKLESPGEYGKIIQSLGLRK